MKKRKIICVAGKGNNGGDALVIARQLFSIYKANVSIVVIAEEGSEAFNFNLNICKNLGIKIFCINDKSLEHFVIEKLFASASIIFDGIAGTGIEGKLKKEYLKAAEMINNSTAKVVSIDIPSGTGDSYIIGMPAVKADFTMTVGLPKRCLYYPAVRSLCGNIKIIKIGFPDDVLSNVNLELDRQDWKLANNSLIKKFIPKFENDVFKNIRGHLAIFAGSKGTTGAASLAARAATHTSAGLVSLLVYEDIYDIMATRETSPVMVKSIENLSQKELSGYNAVAVGPGWGCGSLDLLNKILKNIKTGVLDADGLNILSNIDKYPNFKGQWVLTPHIGEFKRLFPDLDPISSPFDAVSKAAAKLNAVVLLKGAVSFIASPKLEGWVIDGVYPKLATAGSGDLLCGIIAGYLASGLDPFKAAVLGCLVHLRAAKRCGEFKDWVNAEDILSYL